MKKTVLLLLVLASAWFFWSSVRSPRAHYQKSPKRGFATLYSKDPMTRTYSFTNMDHGTSAKRGDVYFESSELDFSWIRKDHFTAGILEGEKGIIIDMGKERLHPDGIPLYYSLMLKDRKGYVKEQAYVEDWKEVKELDLLFLPWKEHLSYVPVEEGHTYVVRIFNEEKNQDAKEIIVKLFVLEFVPNRHVTFRWEML